MKFKLVHIGDTIATGPQRRFISFFLQTDMRPPGYQVSVGAGVELALLFFLFHVDQFGAHSLLLITLCTGSWCVKKLQHLLAIRQAT